MEVVILCFDPEKREVLDQIIEDYKKFRSVEEEPENVYRFAYWLMR